MKAYTGNTLKGMRRSSDYRERFVSARAKRVARNPAGKRAGKKAARRDYPEASW